MVAGWHHLPLRRPPPPQLQLDRQRVWILVRKLSLETCPIPLCILSKECLFVFAFVCVFVCIYLYICVYVCIHVCVCRCVFVNVICVCIFTSCIRECGCVSVCMCMCSLCCSSPLTCWLLAHVVCCMVDSLLCGLFPSPPIQQPLTGRS